MTRAILYAGSKYPRRHVLTAESIPLEDIDHYLAKEFEESGWLGPDNRVSFARVIRRDEEGAPFEIRETTAPGHLLTPEDLDRCDDENLVELGATRAGRAALAHLVREGVSLGFPREADRETLDLSRGERAIRIHREYRNLTGELLIDQSITLTPDVWLEYHRNLMWERAFRPELASYEPWDEELRRRQDPESMMGAGAE